MLEMRAIAECRCGGSDKRPAGTRQRVCTVLRVLPPGKDEPGETYAVVKFEKIDRVYLKNVKNVKLLDMSGRGHRPHGGSGIDGLWTA